MVSLLRKLYLYFTKDPEGVHYFPGKGVPNFLQGGGGGVQMLISLETHVRTCYFPGGCPDPLPPLDPHMGNVIITGQYLSVPLLTIIVRHSLMTDEVFQMMHWYCARLTPSRNTALGSGSFCNSVFFSPKYPQRKRSESNNIGDWLIQSKKDGKDQESIESSTTPDPGYQWESKKLTVRHHRRELRSQDNLQIYYYCIRHSAF